MRAAVRTDGLGTRPLPALWLRRGHGQIGGCLGAGLKPRDEVQRIEENDRRARNADQGDPHSGCHQSRAPSPGWQQRSRVAQLDNPLLLAVLLELAQRLENRAHETLPAAASVGAP